jgi:hypothetical protein
MEFVLTGFSQDNNMRRYTFAGVAADRSRTVYTVDADLALVRKHRIAVQELPLLCRCLLDEVGESAVTHTLIFTEEKMLGYADRRAAAQLEAEQKRKAHRRPPSSKLGQAWRAPGA